MMTMKMTMTMMAMMAIMIMTMMMMPIMGVNLAMMLDEKCTHTRLLVDDDQMMIIISFAIFWACSCRREQSAVFSCFRRFLRVAGPTLY